MAETVFHAALVAAFVLLLWRCRPGPAAAVAAGLALGYAGVVRSVGMPLVALFAAYLVIRRVGWRSVAAFLAGWVVVVGAYAVLFDVQHGQLRVHPLWRALPLRAGRAVRRLRLDHGARERAPPLPRPRAPAAPQQLHVGTARAGPRHAGERGRPDPRLRPAGDPAPAARLRAARRLQPHPLPRARPPHRSRRLRPRGLAVPARSRPRGPIPATAARSARRRRTGRASSRAATSARSPGRRGRTPPPHAGYTTTSRWCHRPARCCRCACSWCSSR